MRFKEFQIIFLRKILKNKKSRIILLLALTPAFWWIVFQPIKIIQEWSNAPVFFKRKINSVFSIGHLRYSIELRGVLPSHPLSAFSTRLFYNKATVVIGEAFDFADYLSPRFYFQQDSGNLLPAGVEPIPVVLFPFWIFGILKLIKEKNISFFIWWIIFGLLAFIVGQRNYYFLFPVIFINIFLINEGFTGFEKSKYLLFIFWFMFIYSSYLLTRALWLTF